MIDPAWREQLTIGRDALSSCFCRLHCQGSWGRKWQSPRGDRYVYGPERISPDRKALYHEFATPREWNLQITQISGIKKTISFNFTSAPGRAPLEDRHVFQIPLLDLGVVHPAIWRRTLDHFDSITSGLLRGTTKKLPKRRRHALKSDVGLLYILLDIHPMVPYNSPGSGSWVGRRGD